MKMSLQTPRMAARVACLQGYGVYVFGSGQRYEGHWEKGKKHGWSIYTVETGQRWAGSWVEGKPQWVHPVVGEAGLGFRSSWRIAPHQRFLTT